jgi:pyridinium-3,5-bisthiocarboxylic acid mononucleotide nickel chelatase
MKDSTTDASLCGVLLSMKIAYLDCFSGISGDMLLGALVDAGVPMSLLQETVRALNVGAEITAARVDRNGISATKVDVIVDGLADMPREEFQEGRHAEHTDAREAHVHEHTHSDGTRHSHSHEHDHLHSHGAGEHSHPPEHEHKHSDGTKHSHPHSHEHRGLKEIREVINAAKIAAGAKKRALQAFQLLGEAEAKIHNKDVEKIHFHEVGSVDAIVDIVCGAVAAEYLKVDQWVCSPLNVGSGTVVCAHGTLPIPAPATLELLKDAPIYSGPIQKELVTPTGAAMVRTLTTKFGSMPKMKIAGVGYGAGARNFSGAANVLRVTIGESMEQELATPQDNIMVIEANLDDMSPQVFGYVIDRLLDAGALDAFGTPVQMKKSRPGTVLTVLTRTEDAQRIAQIIFAETTTIGLRMRQEMRHTLAREYETVQTTWGSVRIKVARLNGAVTNFAPEYEDCREIAADHSVPLKTVLQEAVKLYLDQHPSAVTSDEGALERHHG